MPENKIIHAHYTPGTARGMLAHIRDPYDTHIFAGYGLCECDVFQFKNVIRFLFENHRGDAASIWITRSGDDPCHVRTKHLNLTLQLPRASESPAHKMRAGGLLTQFARFLQDAEFSTIERAVIEHSGRAVRPDFASMQDLNMFFDTWADPDQALRFMHYDAVWRYYYICYSYRHQGTIRVQDKCVYITHGDAECPRNFFFDLPGLHKFFSFPWPVDPREQDQDAPAPEFFTTDLGDMDIIDGSRHKLAGLLDQIHEKAAFDVALLNVTCLSLIIGDDLEAAIRSFREKTGKPVVLIDALHLQVKDHIRTLARFDQVPDACGPRHRINLVGFAPNQGRDELEGLLTQAGISVNARFLPGVKLEELRNYFHAGVQVFHPSLAYAALTGDMLWRLPLESITPPAPVGLSGAWSFLETVASAAGVSDELAALRERRSPALQEQWDAVTRDSDACRLALALTQDQIPLIAESLITWGVPLIPVLEEMGFRIHVLVHAPDGTPPDTRALAALLKNPGRHGFDAFRDLEQFRALIRERDIHAVYSDIFHDTRITRSGAAVFSMNFLEAGFEGAVRTARRLQALCRMPFYRRYQAYLQPSGE